MAGKIERLREWALNVTEARTFTPHSITEEEDHAFATARYTGPTRRNRDAMIAFAKARNSFRWNRLQKDYAWLKSLMEEIEHNPEDAKWLL